MNWENLFAKHILRRGYNYYCDNAVVDIDVAIDCIRADVIGTEDYRVEISLSNNEITDMYCSCPYAESGNNCKHMAAVLYDWSGAERYDEWSEEYEEIDEYAYERPSKAEEYRERKEAIEALVYEADVDVVRSFLTSVLCENERLRVRFNSMIREQEPEEGMKRYIERYIAQVDYIAKRYLGKNQFIRYYEVAGFISELEEMLEVEVRSVIDHADYMNAFKMVNFMFVLLGNVDMDDSDGSIGLLTYRIYHLWLELLAKVDMKDKKNMFFWFTEQSDGTIVDYLEEYVEQIIMEEFSEQEFQQPKLQFIEKKLDKSSLEKLDWSNNYYVGKWALRYLDIMDKQQNSKEQIEEVCKMYWDNSSVRGYYIDFCMKNKDYARALEVLDESISMDRGVRGLISAYSKKKKEIYLLQGNKQAYIEQLWKLVLEDQPGNLNIYKELKKQYNEEEWADRREEVLSKLSKHEYIAQLYKEEEMYDRLLDFVMQSPGVYLLRQYERVLKKEYPEQLLQKYKMELNQMAAYPGGRKQYQQLVVILRKMKNIKNGSQVVEDIVTEWKHRYRNRPAMMDELRRL